MVGELLRLSEIDIAFSCQPLILKDPLQLGVDESFSFNTLLEADERAKFSCDLRWQSLDLDLLLAARARHEGKGDSQSRPSVLE